MQERNQLPPLPQEVFGMTQEDIKTYQIKSFWERIKYCLAAIGPTIIRILNAVAYWTLKIIKSFVKSVIRMILGKEI